MNRHQALVFILFWSVSVPMFSQGTWLSGILVSNTGDTLIGEIHYEGWRRTPQKVSFRPNSTSKPITYSSWQVTSFFVKGELYISEVVDLEISPTRFEQMTADKDLVFRRDTVFLEVLTTGVSSLYYLKDGEDKVHFFLKKDTTLEALILKHYLDEYDNLIVRVSEKYKGQLAYRWQDCPNIAKKTFKADYTRSSLTKLFEEYNKCVTNSSRESRFIRKKERVEAKFSISGGYHFTGLKFKTQKEPYFQDIAFSKYSKGTGGVGLHLIFPRQQQLWSLVNEIFYTSYQFSGTILYNINADQSARHSLAFDFSHIKAFSLFRYEILAKSTRVFVNAGISNAWATRHTNHLTTERRFFSTNTIDQTTPFDPPRNYEQGLTAGLGIRFRHFFAETRYESTNGMSPIKNIRSKITSFYLLTGWRF